MQIRWLLKNDPLLSNSSLVRASIASGELRSRGYHSVCYGPPQGMSRGRWWETGLCRAARWVDDGDIVVLQKIWRYDVCKVVSSKKVLICFDADDEFNSANECSGSP